MFISWAQGIETRLQQMGGPAGSTVAAHAPEPVSQHQQLPAQPGCPVPEPANDEGTTGIGPVLVVPSTAQVSCINVHVFLQSSRSANQLFGLLKNAFYRCLKHHLSAYMCIIWFRYIFSYRTTLALCTDRIIGFCVFFFLVWISGS